MYWFLCVLLLTPVKYTADGGQLFQENCKRCHGPEGRGGVPNLNAVRNPIPALTMVSHRLTTKQITKIVRRGTKAAKVNPKGRVIDMPAWGSDHPDLDIEALVKYVAALAH